MSRASPVIRDKNVNDATTPVDLNSRSDPAAGEPSRSSSGRVRRDVCRFRRHVANVLPETVAHRDVRAEPQGWSSGVSREGYSRRDARNRAYAAAQRAALLDSPTGAPNNTGPSRVRPAISGTFTWRISNRLKSALGRRSSVAHITWRCAPRSQLGPQSAQGRGGGRQRGGGRELQGRRTRDRPDGHEGHPAQEPRGALQEPAEREATRHGLTRRDPPRVSSLGRPSPGTSSRPGPTVSCPRPPVR